jgi:hypothetical protein
MPSSSSMRPASWYDRRAAASPSWPKPYTKLSGSSMHIHVSLWRQGEPAFRQWPAPRMPSWCRRHQGWSNTCWLIDAESLRSKAAPRPQRGMIRLQREPQFRLPVALTGAR